MLNVALVNYESRDCLMNRLSLVEANKTTEERKKKIIKISFTQRIIYITTCFFYVFLNRARGYPHPNVTWRREDGAEIVLKDNLGTKQLGNFLK